MLGLSAANDRVFVYEVEGLRQNDQTTKNSYPLRNSSNLLIQVPYNRMNDEMLRISRMGGNIIAIHPLADYLATKQQDSGEHDAPVEEKTDS
ncbi:MAG: phycobilisome linker polypeptide [Leptolyngbyaceae cyanobacterium CSU_1_4]|nr:phycobilisome linker polypeptide [Leptolyngbyaceae cyanobacterium CSU_1_4]